MNEHGEDKDYGVWLGFGLLKRSGKEAGSQKGVGSNAILSCGGCLCLIHKKCSRVKGPDTYFRCARYQGTAQPIDGRTVKEVKVDEEKVEAVSEVCFLRDMLTAGGGCELADVTRCKCALGKFCVLALTSFSPTAVCPLWTEVGCIQRVKNVMLHAAETWAMTAATQNSPRHNGHALILLYL